MKNCADIKLIGTLKTNYALIKQLEIYTPVDNFKKIREGFSYWSLIYGQAFKKNWERAEKTSLMADCDRKIALLQKDP